MRVRYDVSVHWTGSGSGAQEHSEEYTVYATLPVSRSAFETNRDLRIFLRNIADELPFLHYQNTQIEYIRAKVLDPRTHQNAHIQAKGIGKYRIPGIEEAIQYRTVLEIQKYKQAKQLQHEIERELSNTLQGLRSLRETLQNAALNLVVYPVAFVQALGETLFPKKQRQQQQQNTKARPYPRIWEQEDENERER